MLEHSGYTAITTSGADEAIELLDAMTSDRPYREGTSFVRARAEIVRCSGTQFDPAIVETFLTISDEEWNRIRTNVGQSDPDAERAFVTL
jgi:response regulator RpfG family c-di-GMP phosphodiesterase